MSKAPPKPCSYPGCGVLTETGRCAKHQRQAWAPSQGAVDRVRGRKLQRRRHYYFMEHPLCAECEARGRVAAATILDHKIPLAEGGADEPSNWQGLCQSCSDIKTEQEKQRGLQRMRGGGG